MITETDHHSLAVSRVGNLEPTGDAILLTLIDQLRECEKRRDDLLDRLLIEGGAQIEAAAKKACDAARAIYEQIAAIKPTTLAGVHRQLELAVDGWIGLSTVPVVLAGFREIVHKPRPLKVGRLPPVPARPAMAEVSPDITASRAF
jgi:hypothetical protein